MNPTGIQAQDSNPGLVCHHSAILAEFRISKVKLVPVGETRDETIPLLAEYTSTSQSVSATASLLVILMVTYLPNKLGRQKNDAPCPGGIL